MQMTTYLEECGSTPLSEILPVIQERILHATTYFGVPALKNPFDFWVYQELIHQLRPNVIIEIGNNYGGSTLALAHLLDNLGSGRIIAVDIDQSRIYPQVRSHPRITFAEGDACVLAEAVCSQVGPDERVMIIEDSSHTYDNTLGVLEGYGDLLKSGDYFIVEDSICHHGLNVGPDPGPYEAVEEFLRRSDKFVLDRSKESFLITWNPKGFLLRK